MPINNPKHVFQAIYYIDERNQWCQPCMERLGDMEMDPQDLTMESGQAQYCTECTAFAAGIHPSLPNLH